MTRPGMMCTPAFLDHAAHIGYAFAALRPVGEMAVHCPHRAAALINRTTHIAFGQTMAQTDIHLRRHQQSRLRISLSREDRANANQLQERAAKFHRARIRNRARVISSSTAAAKDSPVSGNSKPTKPMAPSTKGSLLPPCGGTPMPPRGRRFHHIVTEDPASETMLLMMLGKIPDKASSPRTSDEMQKLFSCATQVRFDFTGGFPSSCAES